MVPSIGVTHFSKASDSWLHEVWVTGPASSPTYQLLLVSFTGMTKGEGEGSTPR